MNSGDNIVNKLLRNTGFVNLLAELAKSEYSKKLRQWGLTIHHCNLDKILIHYLGAIEISSPYL